MKKFSVVIGNPCYQADTESDGDRANPIYDKFMDEAYKIADKVEMITPGRFLFNAGQTSKAWNEKMLSDPHLKVLFYEPLSANVFSGTDIKGGVAITYRDTERNYGSIGVFTRFNEMNNIVRSLKTNNRLTNNIGSIIPSQGLYRFSNVFFSEYGSDYDRLVEEKKIGKGTGSKIVSNMVKLLPSVFREKEMPGDCRMICRVDNSRTYRYIKKDYLVYNEYLDKFNVFIPEANNSGQFGETLADPVIGYPMDGSTDTFLSVGRFTTEAQSENFIKYYKTKFFRALLGVKKATQHCSSTVWECIPLQDFTSNSDINWNTTIHNIDLQLYKKYGLTQEEIDFIETHVKEME